MISSVPAKSIFVRESDMELWDRAVRFARQRRMSMSGLIMLALESYLDREESRNRR
jgi:hypothetical protein